MMCSEQMLGVLVSRPPRARTHDLIRRPCSGYSTTMFAEALRTSSAYSCCLVHNAHSAVLHFTATDPPSGVWCYFLQAANSSTWHSPSSQPHLRCAWRHRELVVIAGRDEDFPLGCLFFGQVILQRLAVELLHFSGDRVFLHCRCAAAALLVSSTCVRCARLASRRREGKTRRALDGMTHSAAGRSGQGGGCSWGRPASAAPP